MMQLDMMFDHGMPHADGTIAWFFATANEKHATDYPVDIGPHMTNTDSGPFQDLVAAVSLRENERRREIGAGWNPHQHQPTDMYATFSEKDFASDSMRPG